MHSPRQSRIDYPSAKDEAIGSGFDSCCPHVCWCIREHYHKDDDAGYDRYHHHHLRWLARLLVLKRVNTRSRHEDQEVYLYRNTDLSAVRVYAYGCRV